MSKLFVIKMYFDYFTFDFIYGACLLLLTIALVIVYIAYLETLKTEEEVLLETSARQRDKIFYFQMFLIALVCFSGLFIIFIGNQKSINRII